MTDTTTTEVPRGRAVEHLDPASLLVDANVRLDPRLDREFVASVKELGVLVPVVAVRTSDGRIRVRFGHRRTLAALQTSRTVPVLVVADESTDDAATVERVIGQYAENTHRAGLTTAEQIGVVTTLVDLGVSAAQIHKRTRIPRAEVDAARAAGRSDLAKAAVARYEFLTLDQSAVLAEFDDDPEAVKALVIAARDGEVRFAHVAERLRDDRAERAAHAQARAELEAAGVTVVDSAPWRNQLDALYDGDGNRLTEQSHRDCPGHAAVLRQDWEHDPTAPADDEDGDSGDGEDDGGDYRVVFRPVWVCTDPQAHGHHGHFPTAQPGDGGQGQDADTSAEERAEAAKAKRREVIANNKAWRTAEQVRREWLTNLLARKSPPKGALRYICTELAGAHWALCSSISQGHQLAASLLGLDSRNGRAVLSEALATATEARAQVIALAMVLGAYEEHTSTETWRSPHDCDQAYLNTLTRWGYQLSDIETLALGDTSGRGGGTE
jgi:ParB family chromosome partitioning protein